MVRPAIPVGLEAEVELLRLPGERLPWVPRPRTPVNDEMKPYTETDEVYLKRERDRIKARLRAIGKYQVPGARGATGPLPTPLEVAWWQWDESRKEQERREKAAAKKRAEEKRLMYGMPPKKKQRAEEDSDDEEEEEEIVELTAEAIVEMTKTEDVD